MDWWMSKRLFSPRAWYGSICVCVCVLSCALLFVSSWIVAHKASLSMEFSKQEHWIGLQFPALGDLPNPGIKTASLVSCIGRWILYHCTICEACEGILSLQILFWPDGRGFLNYLLVNWARSPLKRQTSQAEREQDYSQEFNSSLEWQQGASNPRALISSG